MSRLQEQILPSVEMLMRLWAFWVPTTLTQYTGCCGDNEGDGVFYASAVSALKREPGALVVPAYRVCRRRQGGPLHRGPLVAPVVPQHNLPRVRAPHHNVGVKLGKSCRHDGGLSERGRSREELWAMFGFSGEEQSTRTSWRQVSRRTDLSNVKREKQHGGPEDRRS